MKFLPLLLAALLLVSACQTENPLTDNNRLITEQSSMDKLKSAATATFFALGNTFKLLASQAKIIKTNRGTRIHIPENAFVDKLNGTAIQGEIVLKFIEYHTPGEIIASEIPMVYTNEKGEKEQFESAGMFEVTAFQGDRELELAEGKKLKVELASDVPGKFNFYQLEEDRKDWELKDTDCEPVKNKYIEEQRQDLDEEIQALPTKPRKPVAYKPGDKLFDVKLKNYYNPDLNMLNGVLWKYTGEDRKLDPANNPHDFSSNYNLVYMSPTDTNIIEYILTFSTKTDTVNLRAVPVFKGKLLDKENKRIARVIKEIAESMERQRVLREELKREKQLLRVFEIDQLAVYNYDRQFKDTKAIPMFASFEFPGARDSEGVNVYLVPSEKRVVVKYTPDSFNLFALNPAENNKLLAIMPDNTIYALSNSDIKAMHLSGKKSGDKVHFKLKKFEKPMKEAKELDNALAGL